ncbi:MAG: MBL fold metallo-hydrolase [Acidimicrobiia bacterium]|nr:MBL fold metallo-hydrolase [Acidimicrobiia bacterium]
MAATVTKLGDDLYLIDAMMHGVPERLACYLFDTPERTLVECGPSVSIEHLFAALDEVGVDDVARLVVTHIHLDHAGGAWRLARRFPGARIGVHETGARHLASPERLWRSAARIWGEQGLLDLWGPMEPIAPERLEVVDEGDRLAIGGGRAIDVVHTPGHARHHVVFHEASTGGAFVGDAVGISFPHGHVVQPATPPPDFDPHLMVDSLRRIGALEPAFLGFAHFGPEPDVDRILAEAERRVGDWVSWVESVGLEGEALAAGLRAWVLADHRAAGVDEEVVAVFDRTTDWESQAAGIARWLADR